MTVKKIFKPVASAAEIPALFQNEGIVYNSLECVNWPGEYPDKPQVLFALAHTGGHILVHYKVEEPESRAVALEDLGPVWEDSCVELFLCPSGRGYYNFECNCIGTLLEAYGESRHGRIPAPLDTLASVDRFCTLERKPFEDRATGAWELALRIPATALFKDAIASFDGLKATANVYKCGDRLPRPHYVSWAPIQTPSPDYHRPEFFADLKFEK